MHQLLATPPEHSKYQKTCEATEFNTPLDLNSSKWLYFQIDAPAVPLPAVFSEMCPLTPNQCLWAIAHTKKHGGRIELYLSDDVRVTYYAPCYAPYVGLVFDQNGYSGHGLGSPHTEALEDEMQAYKGIDPLTILDKLRDAFKRYTKHRSTVLHHPDAVSGTTIIPDWHGKPVKFHWTEGHSDVIIEYPATGLEHKRLDTVPYPTPNDERDERIQALDAVSEYGADNFRDMSTTEQRQWADARK